MGEQVPAQCFLESNLLGAIATHRGRLQMKNGASKERASKSPLLDVFLLHRAALRRHSLSRARWNQEESVQIAVGEHALSSDLAALVDV